MSSSRLLNRRLKTLAFVFPVVLAGWAVAVGCGGEAEEIPNSSGDGGDDTDATTPGSDASAASETGAKPVKDAGPPFDAASIDAPEVDVTYGTCADLNACGGAVDGAYKMTGACVSDTFLDQFKQQCPGLQESDVVIKGKGTATATATTLTRAIYAKMTAKLEAPCGALIDNFLGGCPGLEQTVMGVEEITAATCTARTGGGCNCDIVAEIVNVGSAAYTTAGGVLTTDGVKYDYCSADPNLSLKEQKSQIPVTLEFAK